MGFFSFISLASKEPGKQKAKPIMAGTSSPDPEWSRVVVLFSDGRTLEGEYDGYGRVGGKDLVDQLHKVRFVLKADYVGQAYDDVPPMVSEPGQGHFHDLDWVERVFNMGGFGTLEEYIAAFRSLSEPLKAEVALTIGDVTRKEYMSSDGGNEWEFTSRPRTLGMVKRLLEKVGIDAVFAEPLVDWLADELAGPGGADLASKGGHTSTFTFGDTGKTVSAAWRTY